MGFFGKSVRPIVPGPFDERTAIGTDDKDLKIARLLKEENGHEKAIESIREKLAELNSVSFEVARQAYKTAHRHWIDAQYERAKNAPRILPPHPPYAVKFSTSDFNSIFYKWGMIHFKCQWPEYEHVTKDELAEAEAIDVTAINWWE